MYWCRYLLFHFRFFFIFLFFFFSSFPFPCSFCVCLRFGDICESTPESSSRNEIHKAIHVYVSHVHMKHSFPFEMSYNLIKWFSFFFHLIGWDFVSSFPFIQMRKKMLFSIHTHIYTNWELWKLNRIDWTMLGVHFMKICCSRCCGHFSLNKNIKFIAGFSVLLWIKNEGV